MTLPEEITQLFAFAREQDAKVRETALGSLEKMTIDLARRQEKYEDTLNTFFLMANASSEEDFVTLVLKVAQRITDSEATTCFRYMPEKNKLVFHAIAGENSEKLQNMEVSAGEGIVGSVIKNKESLVVNDVAKEPLFSPAVDKKSGFVTRALICMPVLDDKDNVLGAIEVINKKKGKFDVEDEKLLALLAQTIAIARKIFGSRSCMK